MVADVRGDGYTMMEAKSVWDERARRTRCCVSSCDDDRNPTPTETDSGAHEALLVFFPRVVVRASLSFGQSIPRTALCLCRRSVDGSHQLGRIPCQI